MAAGALSVLPSASGVPTDLGRAAILDRHTETGKVGFIGSRVGKPIDSGFPASASPERVARAFLGDHAKELGLGGASTDLRVVEQHSTPGGGTAVRLSQTVSGVPVLGGEFVVNLDAGRDILSVLGEASPVGAASTKPSVGADAAAEVAIGAVAKSRDVAARDLRATTPALSFYDARLLGAPGPFRTARLSWVVDVRGTAPRSPIDEKVVVDAAKGAVSLKFSNIEEAKNRIVCDAASTATEYPCTDALAEWTEASQPATANPDVELAFVYAGNTYDFFFSRFGRDSLNGAGLQLKSTVDYCPTVTACPYENAFWDGDQMVYGDGFASADDVVGHELSHGVTDFSSHLFYYMQSGAINESMSDVFGELIDLTNGSGTDTPAVRWYIGEDVPGFGAIRYMADPTVFGDPDRMLSPFYYGSPADGGGVHLNSGVNNKAAYLLTDGGTFNGQTITALGITKTARIYYTVNNSMLVSGSDYADLGNALRQACANLATTATDGITAADCVEVNEVVLATEMDQNPTNAPTSTPAVCPAGGVVTLSYDNLEAPSGQFTSGAIVGPNGWFYPQNPNAYAGYDATYATSGKTNIWGDNGAVTSDSFIRMTNPLVIPAGGYLYFNHAFGFEAATFGGFDGGVVEYSTAGAAGPWTDAAALFAGPGGAGGYSGVILGGSGNPLAGRQAFINDSNGYGASRANLSSLAGQSVMFRWRIGTDGSFGDHGLVPGRRAHLHLRRRAAQHHDHLGSQGRLLGQEEAGEVRLHLDRGRLDVHVLGRHRHPGGVRLAVEDAQAQQRQAHLLRGGHRRVRQRRRHTGHPQVQGRHQEAEDHHQEAPAQGDERHQGGLQVRFEREGHEVQVQARRRQEVHVVQEDQELQGRVRAAQAPGQGGRQGG